MMRGNNNMGQNKLLIVTQLSNYNLQGKFILECDSGWNMMMGRIREILKHFPNTDIYITGPLLHQCKTSPKNINPDLFLDDRIKYVPIKLIPNALATRYDFNFDEYSSNLDLINQNHKKFTHVYINDPMQLRNLKALFYLKTDYLPKFIVHSHFIDNPEQPKFPVESSLWLGQIEAAYKADWNFWQCESSMNIFFNSCRKWIVEDMAEKIEEKSCPWDDGYSSTEMNQPINYKNIRFNIDFFKKIINNKLIIFVPNRIGKKGVSSDYTNCGKFLFEVVPKVWEKRKDFVVITGNPNQKISNDDISKWCPAHINIVPDALNRDEYRLLAKLHHISVGLYNYDSYGGTASRELCDIGTIPLWVDNYEYQQIANIIGWDKKDLLVKPDLSNCDVQFIKLLDWYKYSFEETILGWQAKFRHVVKERCSYEQTTKETLTKMNLL
jgi:hypothetical protein